LNVLNFECLFDGSLPNDLVSIYKRFDKLYPVVLERPFKRKRMYINVVEWLMPNEVLMKMAKVSREWYMITWNYEALRRVSENVMGKEGYKRIKNVVLEGMIG
jgi:hypothetical protein